MGVIKRQSIKQSIVRYIAVSVGLVNLFVYTATLSKGENGFRGFCIDTAIMLTPFLLMGGNSLSVRYFPMFKDKYKGHNGFLFLMLLLPSFGLALFLLSFFFFKDFFLSFFEDTDKEFLPYFIYILPLVIFMVYTSVLATYCSNLKLIVVPVIFNDLFVKVSIPVLAILYFYGQISFLGFIQGLVLIYFLVLIALIFYVKHLGQLHLKPNFKKLTSSLRKEMSTYVSYTILGSIGGVLATRIDIFMVSALLGFDYGGVYIIVLMIGNVIDVPRKAITGISAPIISEAWKKNDLVHIKELYLKTAIIQLIVGVLILAGIWASIDLLFDLLPNGNDYRSGKWVVLILGISRLVDMATGVNGLIINYSKYFRFSFYAVLTLAVLNIITNYIFIPIYYINGAALATLASVSIYNVLKLGFIYYKLQMHPVSWEMLWVILLGISAYWLSSYLPSTSNTYLDIIFKSLFVSIFYGGSILLLKISPDINQMAMQGLNIVRNFWGNRNSS